MYGYVYALVVAVLWGFAAILENLLVKKFNPLFLYVISGATFGVSALAVYLWNRSSIDAMFGRATARDLGVAVLMALGAVVLANYFFLLALEKTSKPSVVTAMAYCAPIFTLIGSIVILQYKVSRLELVGIATTIAGVCIVAVSVK